MGLERAAEARAAEPGDDPDRQVGRSSRCAGLDGRDGIRDPESRVAHAALCSAAGADVCFLVCVIAGRNVGRARAPNGHRRCPVNLCR